MSTIFIPTVTEIPQSQVIVTKATKIIETPPVGTLMRATLGATSFEFRVAARSSSTDDVLADRMFGGTIDGPGFEAYRTISFWIDVPWIFEILDEPNVLDEELAALLTEDVSA